MSMQQFCLRWNNHQPNFISVFSSLLNNETLVDVTLAAEGRHLQAHKVVLSACSTYFQSLFTVNPCQHPIVILKDVKFSDLKIMVDFMYYGEVNVSQDQLPSIIKTAESLKIKGLAEMHTASLTKWPSETGGVDRGESCSPSPSPLSPSFRRKRLRKGSTGSTSGGSADKTEEINEITLVATNIVKPEPHIVPQEGSEHLRRPINATTDTQGSIDEDQISIMSNMESSTTTTPAQSEGSLQEVGHQSGNVGHGTVSSHPPTHQGHQQKQIGTKHGRLLMRQPRVKKESEPGQRGSPESEPGSPRIGPSASTAWSSSSSASSPHITGPNVKLTGSSREQSWDDSTDTTPGGGTTITTNAAAPVATNLLTVPQPSYLVKQHSHPLLPSQQATPSSSNYWIQRQHSNPEYPGGRSCSSPKSNDPIPLIKIDEGTTVTASTTRQDLSNKCQISMNRESSTTSASSNSSGGGGIRLVPAELLRSSSAPQTSTNPHTSVSENRTLSREGSSDQRGHCPVQRPGPALGCNHCWNTIDTHGRILRRKTKYHCPECQINLCIVPCFQEFHERPREISPLRPLPKTSSI